MKTARVVAVGSAAGALLVSAVLAAAPAENSGGYRGPDRNGIYPASGLLKKWPEGGPKLLWKFDQLGPGWASATVAGDTVYCLGGCAPGNLFAFDLRTGDLKYKKPYGDEFRARFDGTRSTPTVSDGLVIFSSGKKDERSIYCYDAATGERLWHVDGNKEFGGQAQGWGYNESPLVVDDLVVFTLRSKDTVCPPVVALDKRSGRTVWKADPGPGNLSAGDSSISLAGEAPHRIIVDNLWRAILALDSKTGRTLWTINIDTGTTLTPTYVDGYLAVAKRTSDSKTDLTILKLAPDSRSYEELWSANADAISQVVILDGKVFGIGSVEQVTKDSRGRDQKKRVRAWVAYDLKTGRVLKAEPCMDTGSIIAADGMVYIQEGGEGHCRTPKMSLLKPTPDGFECTGSFQPVIGTKEFWVGPTIAQGRLFIRHGTLLACYDLRAGSYR